MITYKIKAKLKEHGCEHTITKSCILVLSVKDNISEFVQMTYGCWYDVIDFTATETEDVKISNNCLKEEAIKLIKQL